MAYFVSMPRLFFGMAERGLMPAFLARVSSRFLTPANAIMTYGFVVALLAISGTFKTLATIMVAMESLIFLVVIAALPVMWRRGEVSAIGLRVIGWAAAVAAALAFRIWLLMQVPANAALSTLGVLLIGTLFYFLARRPPYRE